ncbi:ABC transporter permease [uncultured Polaribacter sp.]|uniref:MlaE family ABC transporter permease n=1 Tax=uncultured Polaribacter sp. TaxID=174711 RepID=UPI002639AACD|nr:ABC transporter permease [uncultured Polaribacter sp.]
MVYLEHLGKYFLMLSRVFKKPQRQKLFYQALMKEMEDLGLKSIGIIMFISFFIGGVIALQTALNLDSPFIPDSLIGFAAKRSIILEFAPTFCCIILAGKVGSYITSSIGTMRVTEQIDALDVMGINSINHLILPKVIATLFFYPFLILLAMCLGIFGGWLAGVLSGLFTGTDYIAGIQMEFKPFLIVYAMIKTLVFSFLIATVPSYHGYYVKGGSIAVGRASTQSVVWTTILIVVANYILTQLLLT